MKTFTVYGVIDDWDIRTRRIEAKDEQSAKKKFRAMMKKLRTVKKVTSVVAIEEATR